MATPLELFNAGKLKEAIAAATELVKKNPGDEMSRGWLVDFLCFAGELERADKQLEAMAPTDPQKITGHTQHRLLVRAEQHRQQFWGEGRVPDFLAEPSPAMRALLEASILEREGKFAEAGKALAPALDGHPDLKGTCNGLAFAGMRDLDDLTAGVFEVLAPNGKFYLVPMDSVERIEFKEVEGKRSTRDLLWRPAKLTAREGPEGDVFLPAIYAGSHKLPEEGYALGRMSNWVQGAEGGPYRGQGQRMLLVGDNEIPFLELKEIVFQK